jgi:site-specific recombinase XerD
LDRAILDGLNPDTLFTLHNHLRPSTRKQYNRHVDRFFDWCVQANVDPFAPHMADILNFLQTFVTLNRKYSTIRSYAGALRDFYFFTSIREGFESCVYRRFLHGAEALVPLPMTKVTIWDVAKPLDFLRTRSIPTCFKDLGAEAALLLLLATGFRVADLTCISASVSFSTLGMTATFAEHRKVRINRASTNSFHLPFSSELRVCPVRAIQRFQVSADVIRLDSQFFFISSTGFRAATKTLQVWVQNLLRDAGVITSAGSCRAATTSFAFAAGVPLEKILKSAGWATESTFFQHYRRDVDPSGVNLTEGRNTST